MSAQASQHLSGAHPPRPVAGRRRAQLVANGARASSRGTAVARRCAGPAGRPVAGIARRSGGQVRSPVRPADRGPDPGAGRSRSQLLVQGRRAEGPPGPGRGRGRQPGPAACGRRAPGARRPGGGAPDPRAQPGAQRRRSGGDRPRPCHSPMPWRWPVAAICPKRCPSCSPIPTSRKWLPSWLGNGGAELSTATLRRIERGLPRRSRRSRTA